jgi:hypothetical protein
MNFNQLAFRKDGMTGFSERKGVVYEIAFYIRPEKLNL